MLRRGPGEGGTSPWATCAPALWAVSSKPQTPPDSSSLLAGPFRLNHSHLHHHCLKCQACAALPGVEIWGRTRADQVWESLGSGRAPMMPQRTRLLGQAEHSSAVHPLCTVIRCTRHPPTQPQTSERPKTLTDTSRKGRQQTAPQVRLPPRKAKPAVWTHAMHRLIARGSANKEPLPRQPEPPRAQGYSETRSLSSAFTCV